MSRRTGATERPLRRPVVAGALLLAVYVVLSLFMNPGGYLGTDTGAKVATLEVMDQRDTWQPEVGYWAEQWDPTAEMHPLYGTTAVEGRWVNVTTLPMLELAHPLYDVGGYRLALLLPMLGAVGTAFAARAIAQRLAGEDAGWRAFWLVGLASSIVVYALDFWEHAPGVACMVGGVALLSRVLEDASWRLSALAGVLFGVAASMRGEAFVYTGVAVGLTCLSLLLAHRGLRRPLRVGLAAVAGFVVPWAANGILEASLGGASRGERAEALAGGALSDLGERLHEGMITTFATGPGDDQIVLGVVLVGLAVFSIVMVRRSEPRAAIVALVGVGLVQALMLAEGLGFVPGLFATVPVAALALAAERPGRAERLVLGIALIALPLVWATQFTGGAGPQWGGRYTLTSAVLLLAVGVTRLGAMPGWYRRSAVVLSVAVTATGLAWLSERSHDFDRFFDRLVDRPEDIVVADNLFFIREGGPAYVDRLWLNTAPGGRLAPVVEVVGASGHRTFALVTATADPPDAPEGTSFVGSDDVEVVDVPLHLHSYELTG